MSKKPEDLKKLKQTLLKKAQGVGRSSNRTMPLTAGVLGGYGWYLGIPLIMAVFIGRVLDKHFPQGPLFWTLVALGIGFIIGFVNAHMWLVRQSEEIRGKKEQ